MEKPRVEGTWPTVAPCARWVLGVEALPVPSRREGNTKNLKPFRKKNEAHKILLRGVRLPCSCSPLAFTQPVTKRSRVPLPGL